MYNRNHFEHFRIRPKQSKFQNTFFETTKHDLKKIEINLYFFVFNLQFQKFRKVTFRQNRHEYFFQYRHNIKFDDFDYDCVLFVVIVD